MNESETHTIVLDGHELTQEEYARFKEKIRILAQLLARVTLPPKNQTVSMETEQPAQEAARV